MYRLSNIKIRQDISNNEVFKIACKKNKIDESTVTDWKVFKKSIDARNKDDIFYNYSIDINTSREYKYLAEVQDVKELEICRKRKSEVRPVIVGAGPAGLFCALVLAQNGVKPIVIEQGKKVEDRQKDVEEFINGGKLNTLSNIQFGEGGAGTFSDGKLTTGISSPYCRKVLEEFHNFGAPEQILYINKPHLGTDNLVDVVRNMRNEIIRLGGEFLFSEKVKDLKIENGKVVSAICSKEIETDTVVLAIGHSARDTFERLYDLGLDMKRKVFSVGVRIEHKQDLINESQYGKNPKLNLPPAEYKLAYHNEDTGRSCYTFCMCPGGQVMASSSEENTIVTNGMSKFARDGENANSALLVNVNPEDLAGDSPLEGIYFQKDLEEKAFVLGGSNYHAPIQRVEDFIAGRKSEKIGDIKPSYMPGVTLSDLNTIMPEYVSSTLKEGILYFDRKIKNFANPDSILTGMETRSSSPVTIVRNENYISNVDGIYPCGEGAGYAGGIMSAAVDGIRCAIAILEKE